jgi:hypothetical protein
LRRQLLAGEITPAQVHQLADKWASKHAVVPPLPLPPTLQNLPEIYADLSRQIDELGPGHAYLRVHLTALHGKLERHLHNQEINEWMESRLPRLLGREWWYSSPTVAPWNHSPEGSQKE